VLQILLLRRQGTSLLVSVLNLFSNIFSFQIPPSRYSSTLVSRFFIALRNDRCTLSTTLFRIQFVRDSLCMKGNKYSLLELRMHSLDLMWVWLMCVAQYEVSGFFYQEFRKAGRVFSTCLRFSRADNTTITLLSRSQIKHFTPHTSPLPTITWEWKRVIIRVDCVPTFMHSLICL